MHAVTEKALLIRDYEKHEQWDKLRIAYRQLFESIVVCPAEANGARQVRFNLREKGLTQPLSAGPISTIDPYSTFRKVEDKNCTSLKLVDLTGIEPVTSNMPC